MSKENYSLSEIKQAVEIATSLTRSWFRGHSKPYNELTPGIFREKYNSTGYRAFRPKAEFSMIESFKRQAPALSPKLPDSDDHTAWLFLMQHHGVPTRLLDWSKNILVALYFAVNNHVEEDGELWAMHPEELNQYNGFFGIPTPRNSVLKFLAAEPCHHDPDKLAEEMGLEQVPQYPLAVDPPLNFARMVAQQSVFTIHPKPESGKGTIFSELLREPKYLVRYVIPGNQKKQLLSDLLNLGITELTLFPNLDSLSKDIIKEHDRIAFNPLSPPKW